MGQKKPFNPIVGETYQASFFDGTQIFMEQVSQLPPVSAWDVEAPGRRWRLHGYGEAAATVSGNSIKAGRIGRNVIEFADGGRIEWTLPTLNVGGLVWGARTMEYLGEMSFTDAKNGLEAVIRFDSESREGSWWGSGRAMPTDLFRGSLISTKKVGLVNGSNNSNSSSSQSSGDLSAEGVEVASFFGSWCERLVTVEPLLGGGGAVGAERLLWEISAHPGYEPIPHARPLPSDSRYRADMQALFAGDLVSAKALKEQIERAQRVDTHMRMQARAGAAAAAAVAEIESGVESAPSEVENPSS